MNSFFFVTDQVSSILYEPRIIFIMVWVRKCSSDGLLYGVSVQTPVNFWMTDLRLSILSSLQNYIFNQ